MNDPQRWADDPRAPKGSEDILRAIEPEPPFDEAARRTVRDQLAHATRVVVTPRMSWRAPVVGATALVLAGLLIWRFQPIDEPEVELRPEVAAEVDQVVVPMPAASIVSRVAITSEPAGAEISVDGVLRGSAPLQLSLAEGTYTIRARLAGYVEAHVTHRVVAGERSRLALALARDRPPMVARVDMEPRSDMRQTRMTRNPPDRTGALRVNTNPWSRVYVDGRFIGNTPISRHVLSVGRHRVRFQTESGASETVAVTIRDGDTTTLIRRLDTQRRSPDLVNPF